MITLLHILVAISSVAVTTLVIFRPSASWFRINYGLIGATLISGTYLVWSEPAHMLTACVSGLVYATVVTAGTVVARMKFKRQIANAKNTI